MLGQGRGKVLIGKDTRLSGYMFESALEAGLVAAGVNVRLLGPMSTPGVAYLTRTFRASAGIVITASHNPYQDNGIKFFSAEGDKLPDDVELAIEATLAQPLRTVDSSALGKVQRVEDVGGRYIEFCKSTIPATMNFRGLKLVVDCANGATYNTAPYVFEELGATVVRFGTEPDGFNINRDLGSTKPETLCRLVEPRSRLILKPYTAGAKPHHRCAQLLKHIGRSVVGRTIGAMDERVSTHENSSSPESCFCKIR